jgi:hypothetical protein
MKHFEDGWRKDLETTPREIFQPGQFLHKSCNIFPLLVVVEKFSPSLVHMTELPQVHRAVAAIEELGAWSLQGSGQDFEISDIFEAVILLEYTLVVSNAPVEDRDIRELDGHIAVEGRDQNGLQVTVHTGKRVHALLIQLIADVEHHVCDEAVHFVPCQACKSSGVVEPMLSPRELCT